ncbi:sirohydrochlorin cobaltochelatase [Pseudodesulfovibrio senegalensis]|uniref:Cobalt chelatase n=1 Tax=Pseudodesulfovibrio senegalensis TaxID=1721087 RepID=A0A6N6N5W8_9BACT|nr:sirohydrochlorin cobaltochelatase [Pseudodesulfovibrio senegalensis]KAB1442286.1 cobalt chelatase [Pseudodesulfovibrio senegalensis]
MNNAIILASYGSRHQNSVAALDHMVERVRTAWPGVPVLKAYTSRTIRGRMTRAGEQADSVAEALQRLLQLNVRRVAVQSLHMIPGSEFHDLLPLASKFMLRENGFERVEVGFPLLAGEEDIEQVAGAILSVLPAHRKKREAVLLMGHGTLHPGNVYYEGLHHCIQLRDPDVFVGALEAEPGIEKIRDTLLERGVEKAFLLPFLFGAGHHASKDMVGKADHSWKNVLERAGIACEAVLKGAGEYDVLADIWLAHLDEAMKRLDRR